MFFIITSLTEEGQPKEFGLSVPNLESGLSIINRLALLSEKLISVHLIDDENCMQLPVEIFDGSNFCDPIQALQRQWEECLSEPGLLSDPIDRTSILQRALNASQKRVNTWKHTRSQLQQLMEHAMINLAEGSRKATLLNHYKKLIGHYNRSLNATETRAK